MNSIYKEDGIIQIVHEEIIYAPIQQVFSLACPVMEYKWITGWKCELLHCPNGHVEKGTIFNEIMSAPFLIGNFYGKTNWTAVLHNGDEYRVHYQLENSASSSLYKIEMESMGLALTRCRLDFTYKALNERGKKIIKNRGAEKIKFMLTTLSAMMKHYAEQGEMLKSTAIKKMTLRYKYFSIIDKFRLLLNNFAMKVMKDADREKFLKSVQISKNAICGY
jgi:hypothetical protein